MKIKFTYTKEDPPVLNFDTDSRIWPPYSWDRDIADRYYRKWPPYPYEEWLVEKPRDFFSVCVECDLSFAATPAYCYAWPISFLLFTGCYITRPFMSGYSCYETERLSPLKLRAWSYPPQDPGHFPKGL